MTHDLSGLCESEVHNNLQSAVQTYLRAASNSVPESTYLSHQTHLFAFLRWCRTNSTNSNTLLEASFQYLSAIIGSDRTIATIRDYASTLVNLLAFSNQQDPEITRQNLSALLLECSEPALQALGERLSGNAVSRRLQLKIQTLLSFLQQRQFGTRTHAYAKLVMDTKSRPEQVRDIDLVDLDLEEGHAKVGVPDTHLVSSAGLLTNHLVTLSDTTAEMLESYIEFERAESSEGSRKPLFTTTNGRATSMTLRRSLQAASEEAFQYSRECNQDGFIQGRISHSEDGLEPINPNQLHQYALSKILGDT